MWTKVKSVRVEMWDSVDIWDTLVINNSCRFSTAKLPTKVSDLANDCCYLTEEALSCAVCWKADKEYVDCCLSAKQDCWDYALNCDLTDWLACKYDASNPCCYQTASEVTAAVCVKADKTYVDCCLCDVDNRIAELQWRWRFLSNWNSTTGKPETDPETLPYTYNSWDYYMVTVVGDTNYKPTGSSYTWAASSTQETSEVVVWDLYAYDWTSWLLQSNHWKTVSFANLSWVPSDNACLCSELAGKQPVISDLSTIRENACCGACAKTIISWYWDIVSHNASEFQEAWSYAQCCDLTTWLSWKVDKVNWINRIYWTDWSWCQTDYAYSDTVTGNSVAKRDACGNLCVADPTCNSHAATKWYVDDKVDNKVICWWSIAWTLTCQTDLQTALNCKQDNIWDLDSIRTWAGKWDTAVQPWDLAAVATSGKYCDLTWIPCATTWGTAIAVSNWQVSVCYDNNTIKVNNSDQIYADYTWLQKTCNLVTNFSNADDTHYPSAKAVADIVEWMSWGNMIKEVYDPCNCRANIYDMDSMFDWSVNKVVTATEKSLWDAKQEALTLPSNPTCWHLVVWWANKKTFVDWWEIPNSATWWCITGTLCDQTDLQNALNCKAQCCDIPTDNCQLANSCWYTTCTGTVTSSDLSSYVTNACVACINWCCLTQWGDICIQWWAESNTKTFCMACSNDLVTAQAAYDWYKAGNNPIICYCQRSYITSWMDWKHLPFTSTNIYCSAYNSHGCTQNFICKLTLCSADGTTVCGTYVGSCAAWQWYIATHVNYTTPYNPEYPWSPATKKYVDDNITSINSQSWALSLDIRWSGWIEVTDYSSDWNFEYWIWEKDFTFLESNIISNWVWWIIDNYTLKRPSKLELTTIYSNNYSTPYWAILDITSVDTNNKRIIAEWVLKNTDTSWIYVWKDFLFVYEITYDNSKNVVNTYQREYHIFNPWWTWSPGNVLTYTWNGEYWWSAPTWDESNTKTFYILCGTDYTTWQEVYDWISSWKNAIVSYWNVNYIYCGRGVGSTRCCLRFMWPEVKAACCCSCWYCWFYQSMFLICDTNGCVDWFSCPQWITRCFIDPNTNYSCPYSPKYAGSPTTKKYVDEKVYTWDTAPSTAVEGQIWSDTCSNMVKYYDWSQWNVLTTWGSTWTWDVTWPNSSVDWHIAVFDSTSWKIIKDWWPIPEWKSYTAGRWICIQDTYNDYSAIRWPADFWYHVPSITEWNCVITALTTCLWLWNCFETTKQYLLMPHTWYLWCSGSRTMCTSFTNYRSTDSCSTCPQCWCYARLACINCGWLRLCAAQKYLGYPVRAFADYPVVPDSSWTTLYDWSACAAWAWIFHNVDCGIISLSGDWVNWITMQDKNVWATEVYSGTNREENIWCYFQRWNNYWFSPYPSKTSGTKVDVSWYCPSTYCCDTFICCANGDWACVSNTNLWWAQTGVVQLENVVCNTWVRTFNWQEWDVCISIPSQYCAWTWISIWAINDYSAQRWPALFCFHVPRQDERDNVISIITSCLGLSNCWCTIKTYLKMPRGWLRNKDNGVLRDHWNENYAQHLWTSTCGVYLQYSRSANSISTGSWLSMWYSYPVRAFADCPVVPDSSWTTLYDWSGIAAWAGIFHKQSAWIISMSWDGVCWVTVADKNIWATTVYNDGDILSADNVGCYFQRWNNYGFEWIWWSTPTLKNFQQDVRWFSASTFCCNLFNTNSNLYYDGSLHWCVENLRWGVTWVVLLDNAINNIWVLSVNGQYGNVIVPEWDPATVVSGDTWCTYTIMVSNSAPAAGTSNTTITFVTGS